MNFENSWYLIECNSRMKVISHEEFSQLAVDEYVLLENFATHHEALVEYQRLIKIEIAEAKEKLRKI